MPLSSPDGRASIRRISIVGSQESGASVAFYAVASVSAVFAGQQTASRSFARLRDHCTTSTVHHGRCVGSCGL
jgi:hypothetical protein